MRETESIGFGIQPGISCTVAMPFLQTRPGERDQATDVTLWNVAQIDYIAASN